MDFTTALDILKRRRWLIAYVVFIGFALACGIFLMTPRQYTATSQVLAMGSHAGSAPVATASDFQSLAVSTKVAEGVRRDLKIDTPIPVLQAKITAKVNFGSNVMPITFTDRSPSMAVRGANAAAIELSNYYRQIAASRFSVVSGYLQKQLAQKRAEIQRVDQSLQQATIKDPYNADNDAAQTLAQQILTLQQQRDSLQADLIGDQAQAGAQNRHLAEIAPVIHQEKATSDPYYQKLRAQESADAAQLALVRAQFKGSYPGLAGLQAQVESDRQELAQAERTAVSSTTSISPSYVAALSAKGQVEAKVAADQAHLNAIDQQISDTEDHLQAVPGMGVKLADLRRQRDLLVTEYQALATRFTDTLATTAQEADVGSVAVVDRAQTAAQTLDKRSVLGIIGSVVGFTIIALGLAFLLEILDSRVRTIAGVENLYGRPVLGTVSPD